MKLFFQIFHPKERIVRIIFSEHNINPNNKKLKANFFKFSFNNRTEKNELSCIRFELDTVQFCREFGTTNQNAVFKRNYYGLAATRVELIEDLNDYQFKFSPILTSEPINYFHCDLYDNLNTVIGQAQSAEVNLRLETLKKQWDVFTDDGSLLKSDIQPFSKN